jgi:nucleoside phosphorylase
MTEHDSAIAPEAVKIIWICAFPLNIAAAKAMLDKIYPRLSRQDPNDNNRYILGEINNLKIAIACLPVGGQEASTAATVAKNFRRTFESIEFVLTFGILGGSSTRECDVQLGDVVVSQRLIQLEDVARHNSGKILPQSGLQRTSSSQIYPPHVLLPALAHLQSSHQTQLSRVPRYLTELVEKSPKNVESHLTYSGNSDNRLYKSHDHTRPGDLSFEECENSKDIHRQGREDSDPELHHATIDFGNRLVEEGKMCERPSQDNNLLCLEMEASGLHHPPSLVVRGICDYANSHKNKPWQQYAAATAAAYAKELLKCISSNQITQGKKLSSELISSE